MSARRLMRVDGGGHALRVEVAGAGDVAFVCLHGDAVLVAMDRFLVAHGFARGATTDEHR